MKNRAELTLSSEVVGLPSTPTAVAAAPARRKVLVLGLFPPPVNGQRIVTLRMFNEIAAVTTAVRRELDRFPRLGVLSKPLSAIAAALMMPLWRLARILGDSILRRTAASACSTRRCSPA